MSPSDRRLGSTPARVSEASGRPAATSPIGAEGGPAGGPPTDRRGPSWGLAWRAIRRHWWQAFLLWSAGSAGLMALARDRVRPTFEASSAIRVEPGDPPLARGRRRLRGLSGDPGPAGDQPRGHLLGPVGPPRTPRVTPAGPRPRPGGRGPQGGARGGHPRDQPDPGLGIERVGRRGGGDRQRRHRRLSRGRARPRRGR